MKPVPVAHGSGVRGTRLGGRGRRLVSPLCIDSLRDPAGRQCPVGGTQDHGSRVVRDLSDRRRRRLVSAYVPRGQRSSGMPLQLLRVRRGLVGQGLRGNPHGATEPGAQQRCPGQPGEQHRLEPDANARPTIRPGEPLRWLWHWHRAGGTDGDHGHGLHNEFQQVRIFLSWSHGIFASFEVARDAYSILFKLCVLPTMKLSSRYASLVLARLGRSLQSLQEFLKGWVPQQAPALVPIPIRADCRSRGPVSRHPYRGG